MAEHSPREFIFTLLSRTTAEKDTAIDETTELYYDLGIYGDDLAEILREIALTFGVSGNIDVQKYGPSEGFPPLFFRRHRRQAEKSDRKYASLTPANLIAWATSGVWSS